MYIQFSIHNAVFPVRLSVLSHGKKHRREANLTDPPNGWEVYTEMNWVYVEQLAIGLWNMCAIFFLFVMDTF